MQSINAHVHLSVTSLIFIDLLSDLITNLTYLSDFYAFKEPTVQNCLFWWSLSELSITSVRFNYKICIANLTICQYYACKETIDLGKVYRNVFIDTSYLKLKNKSMRHFFLLWPKKKQNYLYEEVQTDIGKT